jgi:hypothetical protein
VFQKSAGQAPARSGRRLACRRGRHLAARRRRPWPVRRVSSSVSARQDAQLYGRRDACRYILNHDLSVIARFSPVISHDSHLASSSSSNRRRAIVRTHEFDSNQFDVLSLMVNEVSGRFVLRSSRQFVVIHPASMPPMHPEDERLPHKAYGQRCPSAARASGRQHRIKGLSRVGCMRLVMRTDSKVSCGRISSQTGCGKHTTPVWLWPRRTAVHLVVQTRSLSSL